MFHHRRANLLVINLPHSTGQGQIAAHTPGSSYEGSTLASGAPAVVAARNSISCLVRSSSAARIFSSGRVMRYSAAITLLDSPSRA